MKNPMALGVSLVGGILLSLLSWTTLRHAQKNLESRYKMSTVVRLKKYIPQGKTLSSEDVEEVAIPEAFIEPHALTSKAELKKREGKGALKARIEFHKGEQATWTKITDENLLTGLSWLLDPKEVALTLRLGAEDAVGGFIQPGDWVAIFITTEKKATLLHPRVHVVGVQNRLLDAAAKTGFDSNKVAMDEGNFVTLGLLPRDAIRVVLSTQKSHLTLALTSSLGEFESPPFSFSVHDLHLP